MKNIPLRNKAGDTVAHAIVDDEDYEELNQYNWHVCKAYAARNIPNGPGRYTMLKMHRQLSAPPDGFHVDHINGNKLDNRKSNLRHVTCRENSWNRKQLSSMSGRRRGVYWRKDRDQWIAKITVSGTFMHLGSFDKYQDAVSARDAAEAVHFGVYSRSAACSG